MLGFVTRQTISQMFEPAISSITLDSIIKAEEATQTMNRVVNPHSLANPDDEYSSMFIDKLSEEPMKTGNLRKIGLINGIRRIMIAIINDTEINSDLIVAIHSEVSETAGYPNTKLWRTSYVDDDDEEAVYAQPQDIMPLINHTCFCYLSSSARPIIKAAAFEAAIECIHPFNDANGRCARLCLALALAKEKYPPIAFPTKKALLQYHDATKNWVRYQDANPLLNLIAANVEEEAKNRTIYAIF